MQLLKSWKESLAFFMPRTFWSLLKESVSLFGRSMWVWLKKFWWILALVIVPVTMDPHHTKYLNLIDVNVQVAGLAVIFLLAWFTENFVILSSARGKRVTGVWRYFLYWFVFCIVFYSIPTALVQFFFSGYIVVLLQSMFVAMIFLFAFFLFETTNTFGSAFASMRNAVKMFVLNWPFCVVLFVVLYFLNVLFQSLVFNEYLLRYLFMRFIRSVSALISFLPIGWWIITTIGSFFGGSMMAKFYIKRRQDNPELY